MNEEEQKHLMNSYYNLHEKYYNLKTAIDEGQEIIVELQQRIDKAIEYIQKRFEINEYGEYYFTHTFDNSNMKELLEILGEKGSE